MSSTKLKEQARRHEQQEEWERAIETYRRVLESGDEGQGDVDLPLFNRIGDLYLRIGKSDEAVEYYEKAAERYSEAGLYNNAIALCNKALRYARGRPSLLHKLGTYCAAQGFIPDARRWFIEYAEVEFRSGEADEAMKALEAFAETTEDPEIREILGEKLQSNGHTGDAVRQLLKAYGLRVAAGEERLAEALRQRIVDLDRDADFAGAVLAARQATTAVAEDPAEAEEASALPDPWGEAEAGVAEGAEVPADVADDDELRIESAADSIGLEAGETEGVGEVEALDLMGGVAEAAGIEGADEAEPADYTVVEPILDGPPAVDDVSILEPDVEEEVVPEPLPDLGDLDFASLAPEASDLEADADLEEDVRADLEEDVGADLGADVVPDLEEDVGADLGADLVPDLEENVEADLEEDLDLEPLPLLEGTEPAPPAETAGAEVFTRVDDLLAEGYVAEAQRELSALHAELSEFGEPEAALEAVVRLLELDPNDLGAHRARLEYASRLDAAGEQIAAYLDLGRALERTGEGAKAAAVYQQVLELDGSNEAALAALERATDAEAAAGGGDFVDLGSLLRDEPGGPAGTRFVTGDAPNSGDEDRDFADILSQFKSRVSESLPVDDPVAHYDLGLAYKEMGLVDEAITEFQTALRGGDRQLRVLEELGQCFMEKGQYSVAVKVLARAAALPSTEATDILGVCYHLGRCHEALGQADQAREAYERVVGIDMRFRDVQERLAAL